MPYIVRQQQYIAAKHHQPQPTHQAKSLTFQLDIIIFYKRKTNFYDLKASVYW